MRLAPMPHVVVHNLEHAIAALTAADQAGMAITLESPFAAAQSLGAGYFLAMLETARRAVPQARCDAVLDCGEAPGLALSAFRLGIEAVRVTAPPEMVRKLSEIAQRHRARLETGTPPLQLDLAGARDPLEATRNFLLAASAP